MFLRLWMTYFVRYAMRREVIENVKIDNFFILAVGRPMAGHRPANSQNITFFKFGFRDGKWVEYWFECVRKSKMWSFLLLTRQNSWFHHPFEFLKHFSFFWERSIFELARHRLAKNQLISSKLASQLEKKNWTFFIFL